MDIKVPEQVRSICGVLEDAGYEAFMVGGCVRDEILSLTPNDHDIATNCLPEKTIPIF